MKKVVFVLPDMGIGGVERSFLGLLRYAPKDELEITLLLLSCGGELLNEVPNWVHIEYVTQVGSTESLRKNISALLKKMRLHRIFDMAKFVYHSVGPKLVGKAPEEKYDIAVAYNDGLATWYVSKSILAKRKIAFVHTDFLRAGYNAQIECEIYKEFESIYFGSKQSKQHFQDLMPEFQEKLEILPSCVDGEYVRQQAGKSHAELEKNSIKLLTVGRLSHEKGMDKIPEVLKLLEADGFQVKWYLIGDGTERSNLIAQAKRLGVEDSLIFLGAMRNPYPYMAQCDVYVQPSNYEGYCIALAEARALGKPCIACSFAGAEEQIKDGITGFVTDMAACKLYEKVSLIIQNPHLLQVFHQNISIENDTLQTNLVNEWWNNILSIN